MNSQEALEAIQFLSQETQNEASSPHSSPRSSSSALSLRLSPIARSVVSSGSEGQDDICHSPVRNSEASFSYPEREVDPIRTAFASLLEMTFEPKSRQDAEDTTGKVVSKKSLIMPQIIDNHVSDNSVTSAISAVPPPPPPPPPPSIKEEPSKPLPQTAVTTGSSIAGMDSSTEYNDNEEDDEEDELEESYIPAVKSSSNLPLSRVRVDNTRDKLESNSSVDNIHSSLILENHSSLPKAQSSKLSKESELTRENTQQQLWVEVPPEMSAAERLDEKLDGLLASNKGEKSSPRRDGEGVAMRVHRTLHKIKEFASPYMPTQLPKTTCQSVEKEEVVTPVYATKTYPRSNDITAITVIDTTAPLSTDTSAIPSRSLSADKQRVPMMRMRNPAEHDFLHGDPVLSAPREEDEDEFMQRKSQKWKETKKQADKQIESEWRKLKGQARVKESLNGPDDIIACNNVLWKQFESYVVTRCGDVSDVLVDNTKGNEGSSQYSPEGSAASDDEKSEGSASMMRRLSEVYLKKDSNTVTSSIDGTASSLSASGSRRSQDVALTVLNPVSRPFGRDMPPALRSSHSAMIESNLLAERNFVEDFIRKAQNDGLDLLIHRRMQAGALADPFKARAYLRHGKKGAGGEFCGPWLVWYTGDSKVRKGIDLFDIRSLDKASALQLEQYPLAIPGRSLFLRMNEGSDNVFEMPDETSAVQFVNGMRWLVARMSFNLIVGNANGSCEMLELADCQVRSRLVESHKHSAMNDLTNHLVDKSAAAM